MSEHGLAPALLALGILIATSPQPGGSTVIIDGVHEYRVSDPLFECVRVVLSHRGEPHSPAYIQGISGAAFRIAGPCPCAPTCSAAMDTHELVELLGYEAERMPLNEEGMDPEKEVHTLVERVKDEIHAGRPAIVWHAFTNAEWDVVCGFDEDEGRFIGVGTYRGHDGYAREDQTRTAKCLGICPALGAIFVGNKVGRFDAPAAELAALREAVRHATTPEDRLPDDASGDDLKWRFRNGLGAYDWWIQSFRKDPERVPGMGDRYCLSVYRSTHRAAADFLRKIAPRHGRAEPHLKQAADAFDAEADALDECFDVLCPDRQLPDTPDAERNARAAELLARARESYAAAIDSIEHALLLLDADSAGAPSGKVLQGVPPLRFEDCDLTLVGAMKVLLNYVGEDVSKEYLLGVSGGAFKLLWHPDWCPSSGDLGLLGEEPIRRMCRAVGREYESIGCDGEAVEADVLCRKLVETIDRGVPLLAGGVVGPETCILTGYEDNGNVALGHSYFHDGSQGYFRKAEWWQASGPGDEAGEFGHGCWGAVVVGDRAEQSDPRQVLRDALAWAVELARVPHRGAYVSGPAAYDEWAAALKRDDFPPDDLEVLSFRCLVNTNVVLDVAFEARKAAAVFLRDMTQNDPPGRQHLLAAANAYEREAAILGEAVNLAPYSWHPPERRRQMADAASRSSLADLVLQAKAEDVQAVEHLARALEALDAA